MITKLNEDQERDLQLTIDKWLKIGRSTKPINREKVENVLTKFYEKIGKEKPIFLFLDSPLSCILAYNIIKNISGSQLSSQLDSQLGLQLRSQLWSQLGPELTSQLGQLWSQLDSQLRSQLSSQLSSQLESQLGSQLWSQLWSQLESQLDSQLRLQLGSQLESQLRLQLGSQLNLQLDSQLDSQLRSQLWSQLRLQLGSQLNLQLDSQLESQLGLQLWLQLRLQLGSQLGSQLESQLWSQLESQLRSQLGSQLESQLESQLRLQLSSQLWSQLESQLGSRFESQLRSQLRSQLGSQLRTQLGSCYLVGNQWCYWKVFYDFCNKIGVNYSNDQRKLLDLWIEEAENLHWWFPYEKIVFISENPMQLDVDEQGRLHNDSRAAYKYKDGYSLWSWHGVTVPQYVIEFPEAITPQKIVEETNAQVRMVMIERYGFDKFVLDSNAKVLDKLDNYELLSIPDLQWNSIVALKMVCPTTLQIYIHPVEPSLLTVEDALRWKRGTDLHENKFYRHGDVYFIDINGKLTTNNYRSNMQWEL